VTRAVSGSATSRATSTATCWCHSDVDGDVLVPQRRRRRRVGATATSAATCWCHNAYERAPNDMLRMGGWDREEFVGTLTRRYDVLSAIDRDPRQKPALAEDLSMARSTVDRAVRELANADLLERRESGYALTTCGELALDAYRSFVADVDALATAADVVETVPSRRDVDVEFLRDATVVRGSVSAPHRPLQAFIDAFEGSVQARGFSPSAYDAYVETVEERVVDAGMTAELVFCDDALTELTSNHQDALGRAVDTGRVDVYRVSDLPQIGLVVLDRDDAPPIASLGVHDASGLQAVVTNDTPAAVEWARDRVDDAFARAERMPLAASE
jgi:predicted transcriptional regulator